MNIVYMTSGEYISYNLVGDVLTLASHLSLSLSEYRRGNPYVLDVFDDGEGNPTLTPGDWYLAQILIPAKTYTIRENGLADDMGFRQLDKITDPLNTEDITLFLWAKEGK